MASSSFDLTQYDFNQESLMLYGKRFGPEHARLIADRLATSTAVRVLNLNSNGSIGDEGIVSISEALAVNTSLTSLSLVATGMGLEGAASLGKALALNSTLKELKIGNNDAIQNEGAIEMAKGLVLNSSLTAFDCVYCNIGDPGCSALGTALAANSVLKHLGVAFNPFGDIGVDAIIKVLLNESLTYLDLSDCTMTAAGISRLAKALSVNTTLEKLYFGFNHLGEAGDKEISKALTTNTTLKVLQLTDNQLGDRGVEHIAKRLSTNSTLLTLCLGGNEISDAGARHLASAIAVNTTLTALELQRNGIRSVGYGHIAEALQVNPSLICINNYEIIEGYDDEIFNLTERNKINSVLKAATLFYMLFDSMRKTYLTEDFG